MSPRAFRCHRGMRSPPGTPAGKGSGKMLNDTFDITPVLCERGPVTTLPRARTVTTPPRDAVSSAVRWPCTAGRRLRTGAQGPAPRKTESRSRTPRKTRPSRSPRKRSVRLRMSNIPSSWDCDVAIGWRPASRAGTTAHLADPVEQRHGPARNRPSTHGNPDPEPDLGGHRRRHESITHNIAPGIDRRRRTRPSRPFHV